ncbi:cation:proton antiporter [Haliangium sp.]|uniref:cation:proton antiporter n=1 Tax=Haliangium sp. TaxID=2663208 RepID=UPI003D0F8623
MHPDAHAVDLGALSFALAMVAGMMCQGIARHLGIPGIVLLLAVGVVLGPDVAGVLDPTAMGAGLTVVVGFSVAVILFEGGLNLELKLLRAQARAIRRLVLWGALITAVGGALVARLCMDWSWPVSILFGTLVIVTGPTVITPLVRRVRLDHDIATILEAEGVFIDAVGATIAIVTLEVVLAQFSSAAVGVGVLSVGARLGVGALVGGVSGLLLALLMRWRRVVPDGLHNTLALSFAIAVYALSNAIAAESGIIAAIVAGMVVGNARSHALAEVVAFKEQLTVLLIATLFVLLAADVRVADVIALGWPGVATVLLLMFVVRPVDVFVCTRRSELGWRKMLFLSWLAPRGIVAAAVASLFAMELDRAGVDGGRELEAMVFLVIAMTVTIQGLSGGPIARLLRVRRPQRDGVLILGANPIALLLAEVLRREGAKLVLIDTNSEDCRQGEMAGHTVLYGNGLEDEMLARAAAESREACIALTPNESVNYLFAQTLLRSFPGPDLYLGLQTHEGGVTADMAAAIDVRVLFGGERDLHWWTGVIRRRRYELVELRYDAPAKPEKTLDVATGNWFLPLIWMRKGKPAPLVSMADLKSGDGAWFALADGAEAEARAWLEAAGFTPVSKSA